MSLFLFARSKFNPIRTARPNLEDADGWSDLLRISLDLFFDKQPDSSNRVFVQHFHLFALWESRVYKTMFTKFDKPYAPVAAAGRWIHSLIYAIRMEIPSRKNELATVASCYDKRQIGLGKLKFECFWPGSANFFQRRAQRRGCGCFKPRSGNRYCPAFRQDMFCEFPYVVTRRSVSIKARGRKIETHQRT